MTMSMTAPSARTVTMLPPALLSRIRRRTSRSNLVKLANLLDIRPYIEEAKEEGQQPLMQMYGEIADAMMCHPDTVRANLATIRKYSADKLTYWLSNGLSFDHIDAANYYAEKKNMTPLALLDFAIENGDEYGRTMTVKQMVAFAGGEKSYTPALSANVLLGRLGKFPKIFGWSVEKTARFQTAMDRIREEFFS